MQVCFCYDLLTGYNSPNVHDYLSWLTAVRLANWKAIKQLHVECQQQCQSHSN